VAVVFATLYAPPIRHALNDMERPFAYRTSDEANRLYREQLLMYHRLVDEEPDKFRLVRSVRELEGVVEEWTEERGKGKEEGDGKWKVHSASLRDDMESGGGDEEGGRAPHPSTSGATGVLPKGDAMREDVGLQVGHPVGLVPLMEGADGIRNPAELEEWFELGLRLIGLAWVGTRYSGGWREPGPLTDEGRALLAAMADYNFTLDLSHMDEPAMLEALDIYQGPIVATHGNCLALLPDFPSNRQFSNRVIEGVVERDGVVGVVPYNGYLKVGWVQRKSRREEVLLGRLVDHIDHICQLAGDARHAGIGSDFDGGFGLQSVPPEIDSVADLQKVGPLLAERGYTDEDVANVLGGNWLRCLKRDLPAT
jgi:microsomal dipeptidase-like Zn-dependent dipeptidase